MQPAALTIATLILLSDGHNVVCENRLAELCESQFLRVLFMLSLPPGRPRHWLGALANWTERVLGKVCELVQLAVGLLAERGSIARLAEEVL